MERFTFMSDGYYAVDNTNCFEDQSEDYNGPAIDRLAAYEETGLLPEEVMLLKQRIAELEEQHRWIPVTERLPKLIPCDAGTAYSEAVNVLTEGRKVLTAVWNGKWFICDEEFWEAWGEKITHWTPVLLPLPELPKEKKK